MAKSDEIPHMSAIVTATFRRIQGFSAVTVERRLSGRAPRQPIRVLELRSVLGTGGGPEKTILAGAAGADPDRYAVTVCYLRDDRDPAFGPAERAAGLPIDYVEIREKHSFDVRIWPALRQLVEKRGIDIVHAHDYKTDLLGWMLARAARAIPLATAHGWAGNGWRERAYHYADKRILRRYPRVVAVSADIRNELIRAGVPPDTVTVILNGIDAAQFVRDDSRHDEARSAYGIPADVQVVGAVGRLDRRKRFDVLMEAFAGLPVRGGSPMLLIAGEGPARAELEATAARLQLGGRCRFLGIRPDIVRIHHALDVFVQSSEAEGTSNALLEAMALRTPIVATAVGGTEELVRDRVDALIVPPNRVELLRSAIEQVLAQPSDAAARAASARRRVESELSFEARMRHVEAIYDELAALKNVGTRRIR